MERTTMAKILIIIALIILFLAALNFRLNVDRIILEEMAKTNTIDNIGNPSYIDTHVIILYVQEDGISTYNLTMS